MNPRVPAPGLAKPGPRDDWYHAGQFHVPGSFRHEQSVRYDAIPPIFYTEQ